MGLILSSSDIRSACTCARTASPSAFRRSRNCMLALLSGIDRVGGDETQRGQAGHEEIVAAARLHEAGKPRAHVRRGGEIPVALDHEASGAVVGSEQKIAVASLARIIAVLDPLLLHEFELPEDAGVQHRSE